MDRQIDRAVEKRLFDLLSEHPFGTDLGECDVENLVAGGLDDLDGDFVTAFAKPYPALMIATVKYPNVINSLVLRPCGICGTKPPAIAFQGGWIATSAAANTIMKRPRRP